METAWDGSPPSKAHIRSINQEAPYNLENTNIHYQNTFPSLVHIMTTKSVDPSHIILALNFHLLKSEI
jgi:hypothetical protein